MKQKNLTGLRAGIYRETQSTRGQTLLELLSALLIFLALAAIFHTISGFSAMLWLLGAGVLTCIAAAIIRHFQKTRLLLPILLAALLLVVLFARNTLLNSLAQHGTRCVTSGQRKKASSCRLPKQTAPAFGWPGS